MLLVADKSGLRRPEVSVTTTLGLLAGRIPDMRSLRLRIRIRTRPDPDEFKEFGIAHFRVGEVYDVSTQLASLLVISGHADPVVGAEERAEAADAAPRFKPPKLPG